MANQKISTLPAAGALMGTELIELVQAGVNVKGTVATLIAVSVPGYALIAPAAGTYNDVVLPGASDFIIDVNTTAGIINYTGWVAQRDGQRVTYSCVGANNLNFQPLTGSAAGNQLRMSGPTGLVDGDSITFQYSNGAGKWLVI
jgi:hypothetical protein